MALWYQCDNSTWWYWTYVADLGPYDGTVPLPRPLWLPNEAAEIDYVVGIPHPSGDPRRFRDGTYDYHVLEGDFSGSYSYWSTPGGALVGGAYGSPTGPAPGAHLFIQFYRTGYPSGPTLPPPKPALAYVPLSLIAGGYGPTIGSGHWSDWQTGEIHLEEGTWSALHGALRTGIAAHDGGPVDGPALVETARSYIEAGSGPAWSLSNGASGVGYEELASYHPVGYFFDIDKVGYSPSGGGVGTAQIAISGASFDASAGADYRDPSPAALSSLTEGVDYIPDPVSGDLVQYDPVGTSEFHGWTDWTVDSSIYSWNPQGYGFLTTSSLRLLAQDGVATEEYLTSLAGWSDIGGIPFDTAHTTGLSPSPIVAVDRTDDFSLAALETPVISVMAYPEVADPTVTLDYTNDVPLPPSGVNQDQHYMSVGRLNNTSDVAGVFDLYSSSAPYFGETNLPRAIWRQPRWRYWVPGGLEFHCPGGARPRVTTTEGRWSGWHNGFTVNVNVAGSHTSGARQTFMTRDNPYGVSYADLQAATDAVLAHLRAGETSADGTSDSGGGGGTLFGAYFNGQGVNPDTPFVGGIGFGYEISHFDGSAVLVDAALDFTPPDLPSDAGGIPSGTPNSNSQVQYEAGSSTFNGWSDASLYRWAEVRSWDDDYSAQPPSVQGSASPPPTSLDLAFGYSESGVSLTGGLPLWSALTDLGTATLPTEVSSGSYAPFTALGPQIYDITTPPPLALADEGPVLLGIPASGISAPTFDLVVMPAQADAEGFAVPSGMRDDGELWGWEVRAYGSGGGAGSALLADLSLAMSVTTPRWRYWISEKTEVQCTTPILRLNQRNDGRGSSRHPRLLSSTSAPSSRQRSAAPRLGSNGHYL